VPPRAPEPRRDAEPTAARRGSTRAGDGARRQPPPGGPVRGRGGIFDVQAYTPRGRTTRDVAPADRGKAEPPRATLRVVDGGRPSEPDGRRNADRDARPADRDGGRGTVSAPRRKTTTTGRTAAKPAPARAATSGGATRNAGTRAGSGGPRRGGRPAGGTRSAKAGATPRRPVRPPRRPPVPLTLADPRRRLRLGAFLALALFGVIGIRLVSMQVVETPAYADAGLADRLRSVTLFAPRGAIFDRSGAALAHSVEARYVYADPELVTDAEKAAAALSPRLGIAASELEERMAKRTLPGGGPSNFEWLARGVPIDVADEIAALNLPGIGVKRDERREVPGADLAANIIGFTGQDLTGLEGLEAKYDELLRGVNGKHTFEAGQGELATAIPGGYNEVKQAQPGSSLVLTLDRDLQFETQQILSDMMTARKGTVGAAVVLDVATGEVLAQASHPTYDAGDWEDYEPTDREDAATSFVVDPGSIHKAIVFGAGLEEGVIGPDTTLKVANTVKKGDTTFSDTHPANGRRMTLAGALAYSSNVTTIHIADLLGPQRLHDYQVRFGLGTATGEGVPGEASGRVLQPSEWSGSSHGSIPIGHSVDVTPLQMAAVYAAIANNGTYVQPHLLKETVAPDGTRTAAAKPKTRPVLSPSNAAALRVMLEAVTTVPGATGASATLRDYRVAGKTGTGKRIVDGQYVPGDVASFIGMAPAENPRYVVAVFAHTPGGGGGDIAAPAFKQIMQSTLRHFRVPPSTTKPPKYTVFP
jgi:cell division protein FtsI (penicillin-binding protein 3)